MGQLLFNFGKMLNNEHGIIEDAVEGSQLFMGVVRQYGVLVNAVYLVLVLIDKSAYVFNLDQVLVL